MRKVNFKRFIPVQYIGGDHVLTTKVQGTGIWEAEYIHEGFFHGWYTAQVEPDESNYTIAIIELTDGSIEEVLPTKLIFRDETN